MAQRLMSLALMVHVMTKIEVSRPQQAVLLAMADHANDDGSRCFPSVDLIAWKLGYKPRAVTDIIRELRAAGILIDAAPAARHRPAEYRIDLAAAPAKVAFDAWKQTHGRHAKRELGVHSRVNTEVVRGAFSRELGVHSHVLGVHSHVENGLKRRENAPEPLLTVKEPSREPDAETPSPAAGSRQRYPDEFESFWTEYGPTNGPKKPAHTAWQRLSKSDKAEALAALPAWHDSENWRNGFKPYPQKYISQRYWEGDPGANTQPRPNGNGHPDREAIDRIKAEAHQLAERQPDPNHPGRRRDLPQLYGDQQ